MTFRTSGITGKTSKTQNNNSIAKINGVESPSVKKTLGQFYSLYASYIAYAVVLYFV